MEKIDNFQGEYRFLSNFYHSPIRYYGILYNTVEHAYQAAKTKSDTERKMIADQSTPGKAKRAGRTITLRDNWEMIKIPIMHYLCYEKFKNYLVLQKKLIETNDAQLVEGNKWGDVFWGVCDGKGRNELGKILMDVRDLLNKDNLIHLT